MERLTKHGKTSHENGICCTHFNSKECIEVQGNCAYGCKWEEEVWSKLANYEDLEEQGRLIKLPCKVGDAVYVADTDKNMIHPFVVKNIHINKFEILFGLSYAGEEKSLQYWELRVEILRFGKLVFLTKAEAEKALEKKGK